MLTEAPTKAHPLRALLSSRFLKFAFVGASGVLVNLAVFWLSLHTLSSIIPPAVTLPLINRSIQLLVLTSSLIAVLVSILTNFVLNDLWTWADRNTSSAWNARLRRYTLAASLTIVIQLVCTSSLTGYGIHPVLAQCSGIGAGIVLNYAIQNHWTFRDSPVASPDSDGALEPVVDPAHPI